MLTFSEKARQPTLFRSPVHSGRARVERSTSRREIVGDEARRRRSEMRKKMLEEMDRKDDKVRVRDQGSEGHIGETEEHEPGDAAAAATTELSPSPPPYTNEEYPLPDEAEQSKSVSKKKSKRDKQHHSDSMLDDGVQGEPLGDVNPDRLAVEKEEDMEAQPPPPPTSPPPMTDEELGIPGRTS